MAPYLPVFPLSPWMTIFILFLALLPLFFLLMLKYSREHSSCWDADSPQVILSICWWCFDSNMVKLFKFNLYKRKALVFLPSSPTSCSCQKSKCNLWFLFFSLGFYHQSMCKSCQCYLENTSLICLLLLSLLLPP